MVITKWLTGAAAVVALAASTGAARAQDEQTTARFGSIQTLALTADANDGDTMAVAYRGGYGGGSRGYAGGYRGYAGGYRGYAGGYRGYAGGYRGYAGGYRGYAGGYRGYAGGYRGYAGGYRGYYGGYRGYNYAGRPYYGNYYRSGYYRPYYNGRYGYYPYYHHHRYGYGYGYGWPYYLSYFRPYSYYTPYYYGAPAYYNNYGDWPIGLEASPSTTIIEPTPQLPVPRALTPEGVPPMPPAGGVEGTFPYDGGPLNPVPVPRTDTPSIRVPARNAPADIRDVSLPAKAPRYTYPAYGDNARGPANGPQFTYTGVPKNSK